MIGMKYVASFTLLLVAAAVANGQLTVTEGQCLQVSLTTERNPDFVPDLGDPYCGLAVENCQAGDQGISQSTAAGSKRMQMQADCGDVGSVAVVMEDFTECEDCEEGLSASLQEGCVVTPIRTGDRYTAIQCFDSPDYLQRTEAEENAQVTAGDADVVGDLAEEAGEEAEDVAAEAEEEAEDAAAEAGEVAEDAAAEAEEEAENAAAEAEDAAAEAGEVAEDAAAEAEEEAENAAAEAEDAAAEAEEEAEDAVAEAGDVADDVADDVREEAEDVADDAQEEVAAAPVTDPVETSDTTTGLDLGGAAGPAVSLFEMANLEATCILLSVDQADTPDFEPGFHVGSCVNLETCRYSSNWFQFITADGDQISGSGKFICGEDTQVDVLVRPAAEVQELCDVDEHACGQSQTIECALVGDDGVYGATVCGLPDPDTFFKEGSDTDSTDLGKLAASCLLVIAAAVAVLL